MKKILLSLLFPCLLLNIILSEGLAAMDIFPFGVLFYWFAIIISFLTIAFVMKNMALNAFLVVFLIVFWILDELTGNTIFFVLHILSTSLLFAICSTLTIIYYPKLLKVQMLIFLSLSIPVMIIQILGISETAHVLNTLFYDYDADGTAYRNIQLTSVLFKGVNEFTYHSAQGRPPGLFYSNAILSPILLGCSAYFLGMTTKKNIAITDIVLCIAIVLVMSKVSVVGFFMIIFWAWKKCEVPMRKRYRNIFYLTCSLYFLYWVLLPGLFINNLSLNAFYSSSYYRLIDVYIYFVSNPAERDRLISFMSSDLSFNYGNEEDIGGISGLAKVIEFLPFILIFALFTRKWILRSWHQCKILVPKISLASQLMAITLMICSLATPLFKAPSFGYFAGIAVLPFTLAFSSRIATLITKNMINLRSEIDT